MNARRTRWGGRLLAAALLCAGCTTPYSAARDNADAALQRGDLPQAARYEMEACRLEPSSDACVRAEGLRADVEAKALRRASELLDADDPEGALGALRPARELQETPALRARVEQLAGHAAARCAVAPEGTPAQIVARLRCFDALRSLVALPEYDAKVAQEREHAAADLDERARLAQSSRLGGAALAYGALAQCASGTPERSERTARLAAQLAETDAVAVNPLGPDAASACARLEQSFHGRVVCAPATDALPLRVTLVAEPVRHTVQERVKELTYVSGETVVVNPEYAGLQRQAERERARADEALRDASLAKADCETASSALSAANYCDQCPERTTKAAACNRADALERYRDEVDRNADDAEWRLRRADPHLRVPERSTFRYVERAHEWAQAFTVQSQLAADSEPPFTLTARSTGTEHVGFDAAGLEPQQAVEPAAGELRAPAEDAVVERLTRQLNRELSRRAALLRCEGDGPQRDDCRMRRLFLSDPNAAPHTLYPELTCSG